MTDASAGAEAAPSAEHTPSRKPGLRGHRDSPLGRSPFGDTTPAVIAAMVYMIAAITWVLAGAWMPGGRWLAVHLFTLGVITNLVVAFSQHFGRTLTHAPSPAPRWPLPVVNLGILLVLVGLPSDRRWALGAGAATITAVVLASYLRLRRMRKQALGARFAWIVRAYERAHSAFIHGAVLGMVMGLGALSGSWYLAARTAHLHVNVLGWAGLTLLATIVFFGPTMTRTRIEDGADARAAVAIRVGAVGLSMAFWLLLLTGVGGGLGTGLRLAASLALSAYAGMVTVVCMPVARAARRAHRSANRWSVVALATWFPLVAWADVAVVATGRWDLLDVVGLAMFTGVLAQTLIAVLVYVAPMLRARTFTGRDRLLARFERAGRSRAALFNLGASSVVIAALVDGGVGQLLARSGWVLMAVVTAWLLGSGLLPVRPDAAGDEVVSAAASRYRRQVPPG